MKYEDKRKDRIQIWNMKGKHTRKDEKHRRDEKGKGNGNNMN